MYAWSWGIDGKCFYKYLEQTFSCYSWLQFWELCHMAHLQNISFIAPSAGPRVIWVIFWLVRLDSRSHSIRVIWRIFWLVSHESRSHSTGVVCGLFCICCTYNYVSDHRRGGAFCPRRSLRAHLHSQGAKDSVLRWWAQIDDPDFAEHLFWICLELCIWV